MSVIRLESRSQRYLSCEVAFNQFGNFSEKFFFLFIKYHTAHSRFERFIAYSDYRFLPDDIGNINTKSFDQLYE